MNKNSNNKALVIENQELFFQNEEKQKLATDLIIANKELAIHNQKNEKLAAKLIIANKELAFQNDEKEKRAIELIVANRTLALQNLEKEKREADLIAVNRKLAFKNQERDIRAAELNIANRELKKAEEYQKEYIKGLEEMMFLTSHKVRQPIANILGFSNMLDYSTNSPEEIMLSLKCIKQSAITLDTFTRELTDFICHLDQKQKKISK